MPDSCTVDPADTDWSGPALATGARLAATAMVTESAWLLNAPSRTTNENVTDDPAAGAVNVGDADVVLDNVTWGPEVRAQV